MCGYFHSVRFANFFFFYVRSFVLFSFWMTFFMYMRIMMISLWLCLFVCRDFSACSHVDSSTFMLGLHLPAYHTNIPWASRWIAVATAVVSQTGWTEIITRIFFLSCFVNTNTSINVSVAQSMRQQSGMQGEQCRLRARLELWRHFYLEQKKMRDHYWLQWCEKRDKEREHSTEHQRED